MCSLSAVHVRLGTYKLVLHYSRHGTGLLSDLLQEAVMKTVLTGKEVSGVGVYGTTDDNLCFIDDDDVVAETTRLDIQDMTDAVSESSSKIGVKPLTDEMNK